MCKNLDVVFWVMMSCSLVGSYHSGEILSSGSTLKMEAAGSSETLVPPRGGHSKDTLSASCLEQNQQASC
jgi:hypothetical protein